MESMVSALVDEDLAVGPFLSNDLHVGQWDVRIQRAEMHQSRNLRCLICHLRDETAVIADSRRQSVEIAGRRKCHRASKAETHDGNRTGRFQLIDSSRCITQEGPKIRVLHKPHCSRYLVRRITGFKTWLDAIEQRRRDGGVTGSSQTIAYRADVMVHSENLLNQNNPALRSTLGIGAIAAESV